MEARQKMNHPMRKESEMNRDPDTLPLVAVRKRRSSLFVLGLSIAGVMFILAVFASLNVLRNPTAKPLQLMVAFWWMTVCCLLGAWFSRISREQEGIYLLVGGLLLGAIFLSLIVSGFGLALGIAAVLAASAIPPMRLPEERRHQIFTLGALTGFLVIFIDILGAANRMQIKAVGLLHPLLVIALLLLGFFVYQRQFPHWSFALKVAAAGSLVVFAALGVAAAVNWLIVRSALLETADNSPQTAAQLRIVTQQIMLATLVVSSLAAAGMALLARMIVRPIRQLASEAQGAAGGRLEVNVATFSQDEAGVLAKAFQAMNERLRESVETLEMRVQDRTAELAEATEEMMQRAAQMQTVSDIARSIATIQDLDQLLPLITQTISDRLGFYHVGIFLVDANREFAVLRAANSEGGRKMLARGHRLQIGQEGIVGYVTDRGEPRIALDVGRDAVFFNNPDLPLTRSEMALPLIVRDQVIGALDVQSVEANAFKEEDVVVLSVLADQVAIAIENARLFSATRQALQEAQMMQRDYLSAEWQKEIEQRLWEGYVYSFGQLSPVSHRSSKVKAAAGAETEGSGQTQEGNDLAVPISLRGHIIGSLMLQDVDGGHVWTEEEVSLVKAVADQVGLALENARLLETTRQRAEREFMVGQITSQLRRSNDPEEIIQVAIAELTKALRIQKGRVVIQPLAQDRRQPASDEDLQPSSTNDDDSQTVLSHQPDDGSNF